MTNKQAARKLDQLADKMQFGRWGHTPAVQPEELRKIATGLRA